MSKLLAVIGATGNQGGAVIESILNDPEAKSQFKMRGLTRDANSSKSKALAAKGIEMVSADISDKNSLIAAFRGADAVFAVTDYWSIMSKSKEISYGKDIAEACQANKVQHLIWSTLEDVNKASNGEYTYVDHFDGKAELDDYINTLGIPTTFFMPGFYMNNMPGNMIRQTEDGTYKLMFPIPPTTQVPVFDAAGDTGKFVKAILLNRDSLIGKRVRGATNYITVAEIMETFKQVFPEAGKGAAFVQVPPEGFKQGLASAGMPEYVQEELTQMFQFFDEYGYYKGASLDDSHALLKERPTTLAEYFKKAPAYKDLK